MNLAFTPRRLAWLLVVVALGLGALSYWLSDHYLRVREQQVEQRVADRSIHRRVVVARAALARGALLQATELATRDVPERYLASDVVAADGVAPLLGRHLSRDLVAGEPLTRSSVDAEAGASLSALLRPGSRAITITVDEASSSAGLLTPGDLVDLFYLPASLPGSDGQLRVQPLLQAVTVLATGRQTRSHHEDAADATTVETANDFATIALDVTPAQAERVALAARTGDITAVLRPAGEVNETDLEPVLLADLINGNASRRSGRRSRAAGVHIEYIVGGVSGTGRLPIAMPFDSATASGSAQP
jgi:pilus assembly protein CpaB